MENAFGQRVVGRAVKADGKQTTIHLLKGNFHGGIERVSVQGREESTCAENGRDEFILRLLRRESYLQGEETSRQGQRFINLLWFPMYEPIRISRPQHTPPRDAAFMDLNDSQRQVAAAMISITEPLVIAHGMSKISAKEFSQHNFHQVRPEQGKLQPLRLR